ncbi:MAG TPA: hypothetical protein DCZ91_17660 [Lachnospiraceae bacterium]|nr:hypothetical protein [Lachnospiraceae bacterium]
MATWVSHLMIADSVLKRFPQLDRHGFCVGNIAPDCNMENEDWSSFVPSREVTHWMSGERKKASDCDRFYKEYIVDRRENIATDEEYSFLLGYWSHLITDAEYQRFIRDEERVAAAWKRIMKHPALNKRASEMEKSWDSVKKLINILTRTHTIANAPQGHFDKFIKDIHAILSCGILIDFQGKSNFFYDEEEGFYLIDLDSHTDNFYGLTEEPVDVDILTAIGGFAPCHFSAETKAFAPIALDGQAVQEIGEYHLKCLAADNAQIFGRRTIL